MTTQRQRALIPSSPYFGLLLVAFQYTMMPHAQLALPLGTRNKHRPSSVSHGPSREEPHG